MVTEVPLLVILKILISGLFAQPDYCSKFCEACVSDSISCSQRGFSEIPKTVSKTTKQFILVNQQFANNYLMRSNFTSLAPPQVILARLTIRNSNINRINPQTFSDLTALQYLDLTFNNDLFIHSRSFYGLNLKFLKLDHNENISFSPDAFVGFIVESLDMSDSAIQNVPYKLLEPVLPSIKHLFLKNNKIKLLDLNYLVPFRNLNSLYLQNNPFSCVCSMKWLTETFIYRKQNGKLNKDTFNEKAETWPICEYPEYLRGKYLHEVLASQFSCDKPSLTQLKIDFQSLSETDLSCSAIQTVDEAQMSIYWFKDLVNDIGSRISAMFDPDITMMQEKRVHTRNIRIIRKHPTDSFKCIAENTNGNATATVRINWPSWQDSEQKTERDLHLSTVENWRRKETDNYLFQKRFTLLEMLGAVIGTFSATLLVFFLLYKLFFIRKAHRKSTVPPTKYTTYDAAIYSDSQTYDIPTNSYPQSFLLQLPHLTSTPDHFIDFKTQRKFYQTS